MFEWFINVKRSQETRFNVTNRFIQNMIKITTGKTIMMNVKRIYIKNVKFIKALALYKPVCGLRGWATIHAMREMFGDESNDGIILVDACV